VIKKYTLQFELTFSFEVGVFCVFNTNHCHIPWEGRVKYLWLFEFQIIILHLQLELNFNCNPEGGGWSCCWHYNNYFWNYKFWSKNIHFGQA
jgi:hypothetical protein